jgi:ABC-type multidrug transport system fused ATPase/permease subunit
MTPPASPPRPNASIPFSALGRIAPHLWPVGEPMLRLRVVGALLLLAAAKAANVLVPIAYARAVDALAPQSGAGAVITVPIALLVGYGLLRVMSSALGELRNAVFSKVQARAGRRVALDVFRHLHALSMRFHMDRATGGLSRVIERGVRGIATSLNFLLFNIIPTIVEILFVSVILWWMFAASFALTMLGTIIAYVAFTLIFTNWRLRFRRQMNQTDEEANTKAVDSLLNYETVKYFGNEAHESRRYDDSP